MQAKDRPFAFVPECLILGFLAFGALRMMLAWPELPGRMASHFGASGAADGFMPRDGFAVVMAIVGLLPLFLVTALPALIRIMPTEVINMPNRDYWLSPERRERSLARLTAWLKRSAVPLAALLALVVDLTIRANLSHSGLDMRLFGAGLAAFVGTMAFLLVEMYREFRLPPSVRAP